MKRFAVIAAIVCFAIYSSGRSGGGSLPDNCISLNNSGFASLRKYHETGDTNHLNAALELFDQAIACQPNYTIAVSNKMAVYSLKRDFTGIRKCIDRLIELSGNDPSTKLLLGVYFEGLGNLDSANIIYREVHYQVENSLKSETAFNYNDVQLYLMTSTMLCGDTVALDRLDSIKNRYNADPSVAARAAGLALVIETVKNKGYFGPPSITIQLNTQSDSAK